MESIKLTQLLKNISGYVVRGSLEVEITGLCSNSRQVAPGNLFIAKKGLTHDGNQFISDAIASGAAAILTDLYNPFFSSTTQILVEDVAAVEAALAQEYYERAGDALYLIGITGTNGKTTTAYLVKHLFDQCGDPCGLIGTIEWIVGQHVFPSEQTTPDVITNNKLFHEMRKVGCSACVMEVSSHALHQNRVQSIRYSVGVFTNLTQDHLDYHQTMEEYGRVKAKLFEQTKKAVINIDSSYELKPPCPTLTYGIEKECDLRASALELTPSGTRCMIHYQKKSYPFWTQLIGRYNIYNLLAAIGVGIARGFALEQILKALSTFTTVQGRLERVENKRGLHIFVDYAHTDDALANVLTTLKEMKKGRLITVFGCGGSRDLAKRPKMGAVAEALSDLAIVTSDNPRAEDPNAIIRQILSGFTCAAQAYVIPDREEAICRAIGLATPDDIVLIAGKGHETYQIFSQKTIAFDDRSVAKRACGEL